MRLSDLCAELKNWFDVGRKFGEFTISGGTINLDGFVQNGQYFRIIGSVFNDGVYKYPASELTDETFSGAIWAMAISKDIFDLLDDVNDWITKYGETAESPYVSESFGGYSYSKSSATSSGGERIDWQTIFANRLNRWRKI